MILAVIDASVMVAFYVADDPRRDAVVASFSSGDTLFAPSHIDAEIVSALRGLARRNDAVRAVVPETLHHLSGFAIWRMPLVPLLQCVWELRDDITPYDAAYIALAERLDARLITADAKLAGVTGARCRLELIG